MGHFRLLLILLRLPKSSIELLMMLLEKVKRQALLVRMHSKRMELQCHRNLQNKRPLLPKEKKQLEQKNKKLPTKPKSKVLFRRKLNLSNLLQFLHVIHQHVQIASQKLKQLLLKELLKT